MNNQLNTDNDYIKALRYADTFTSNSVGFIEGDISTSKTENIQSRVLNTQTSLLIILCQRLDRIETSLDNQNKKILSLEKKVVNLGIELQHIKALSDKSCKNTDDILIEDKEIITPKIQELVRILGQNQDTSGLQTNTEQINDLINLFKKSEIGKKLPHQPFKFKNLGE